VPIRGTAVTRRAIVVTAAVIEQNGHFLLTRRLEGTHLAGRWEFPGGKTEPGESHVEALTRELVEELAVPVDVGTLILSTTHAYADRAVELYFYEARLRGQPSPQLGQEMRWVARSDLAAIDLPEADADLIRFLTAGRGGPSSADPS